MTKFEDDLNKKMDLKEVPMYFTQSGCSMTRKTYIETNWVFDTYKNWHSDEEFQRLLEQNAELTQENNIVNQIDSQLAKENEDLKSQLQQQALPVVPDFIGKLINTFGTPEDGNYINYAASYPENKKELEWIDNHQKTWLTALLVGFTVEKPQLFYLKHIDMSKADKECDWYLITDCVKLCHEWVGKNLKPKDDDFKFTQAEIDSMETGSYELVPVEDGE